MGNLSRTVRYIFAGAFSTTWASNRLRGWFSLSSRPVVPISTGISSPRFKTPFGRSAGKTRADDMPERFRIVHFAATDTGGPGNSALRIHKGLFALDQDSSLLVKKQHV